MKAMVKRTEKMFDEILEMDKLLNSETLKKALDVVLIKAAFDRGLSVEKTAALIAMEKKTLQRTISRLGLRNQDFRELDRETLLQRIKLFEK